MSGKLLGSFFATSLNGAAKLIKYFNGFICLNEFVKPCILLHFMALYYTLIYYIMIQSGVTHEINYIYQLPKLRNRAVRLTLDKK